MYPPVCGVVRSLKASARMQLVCVCVCACVWCGRARSMAVTIVSWTAVVVSDPSPGSLAFCASTVALYESYLAGFASRT